MFPPDFKRIAADGCDRIARKYAVIQIVSKSPTRSVIPVFEVFAQTSVGALVCCHYGQVFTPCQGLSVFEQVPLLALWKNMLVLQCVGGRER
ncbi:hypothetical protein R2E40_05235 [Aeromonas sp. CD]|uniref:hypothetical protein n=1 Tax=Aeromonas sp. CD TaxID=3080830 RepID=UPI0029661968|nr:hypothetical protein [Aeromonas sp. CD]WOX53521.1 hypothetical protein R2E40_05235 [Aeromonas sp. CD]